MSVWGVGEVVGAILWSFVYVFLVIVPLFGREPRSRFPKLVCPVCGRRTLSSYRYEPCVTCRLWEARRSRVQGFKGTDTPDC